MTFTHVIITVRLDIPGHLFSVPEISRWWILSLYMNVSFSYQNEHNDFMEGDASYSSTVQEQQGIVVQDTWRAERRSSTERDNAYV